MRLRFTFTVRRLMIAVAAVALVLGGTDLARRHFLPQPPRPEYDTEVAWYPGQMNYWTDQQGGYQVVKHYSNLDDRFKHPHRHRSLTLEYHLRRWGPFTWAEDIKQTIRPGGTP